MTLPASMQYVDHGSGGPAGCMQLKNGPLPELKPGEVLIEVAYTGICHTDILASHGHMGALKPAVFGHEGAGIVVEIGS